MRILVVDDEDILRISLTDDLRDAGFLVESASNSINALKILENEKYDVVISDLRMEETDGISLLEKIKLKYPEIVFILMTAFGTIKTAVEAMKAGAYDYLTKPFSSEELIMILNRIKETLDLKKENLYLRKQLGRNYGSKNIISKSRKMNEIFSYIETFADSDSSVLITGETGTGKEVISDVIHFRSSRNDRPYVKVSCAVLSSNLLESELFGHCKGAFTGAVSSKKGRFEIANSGTILLDDVDDIPLELQVKLLRVLQFKEVESVGGCEKKNVDVRVIATTKEDLLNKVNKGEFRSDLYYRLNVIPVHLPPLRERKEDIPLLIREFFMRYSTSEKSIKKEVMDYLLEYSWPGNVRELENLIERFSITCSGNVINESFIPPEIITKKPYNKDIELNKRSFNQIIRDTEVTVIKDVLKISNGNKSKAARMLGLKVSTLRSKIEKFKI